MQQKNLEEIYSVMQQKNLEEIYFVNCHETDQSRNEPYWYQVKYKMLLIWLRTNNKLFIPEVMKLRVKMLDKNSPKID